MEHNHFIIVGGMRCGSTYLARILDEHPEILMASPIIPEPKFFLQEDSIALGRNEYLKRYFSGCEKYKALGEKSVSYLETHVAGERIKKCLPNCKIIIILRDPVTRAISHYWYTRNHGIEKRNLNDAFQEMVDLESDDSLKDISMPPYLYLNRGQYLEHIQVYERLFGREQLMILILEDVVANPKPHIEKLYQFVEVDPNFSPTTAQKKENESLKNGQVASQDTIQKLARYFESANKKLSSVYSLDVSRWTKVGVYENI